MAYHGISWNILWNILWNIIAYHGMPWNILWNILWNIMEYHGTSMECHGIHYGICYGISWTIVGYHWIYYGIYYGISWNMEYTTEYHWSYVIYYGIYCGISWIIIETNVDSHGSSLILSWTIVDYHWYDPGSSWIIIDTIVEHRGLSFILMWIIMDYHWYYREFSWIIIDTIVNYPWGGQEDSKDSLSQMRGQVSKWLQTSFTHLRLGAASVFRIVLICGSSMDHRWYYRGLSWIIIDTIVNHPWGGQEDSKDSLPQMRGQASKWLQTSFTHLRFGAPHIFGIPKW